MITLDSNLVMYLVEERMRVRQQEAEVDRLLRQVRSTRHGWASLQTTRLAAALGRFQVLLGQRLELGTVSQEAAYVESDLTACCC